MSQQPPYPHGSSETKLSFRKPRMNEQQLDHNPFRGSAHSAVSNDTSDPIDAELTRTAKPAMPKPSANLITETRAPVSKPIYTEYGISQTIALLQRLPETQDPSVLMTIVKRTLEATGVNIQDIIKDAQRKKHDITANIKQLDAQVLELENQLEIKRNEIEKLTNDLDETHRVKELLELSEVPPAFGYKDANDA